MGGTALVYAARDLLDKTTAIAARYLQVDLEAVRYEDGVFYSSNRDQAKPQHIAMRALILAFAEVENLELMSGYGAFRQAPITFPNGCHAAEVEVDPDTGAVTILQYVAVDDYGTLLNPMLTESQVQGGIAQGIGQAMLEAIRYDPDSGQLITSSLMDYAVPRAADLPDFKPSRLQRSRAGRCHRRPADHHQCHCRCPQTLRHHPYRHACHAAEDSHRHSGCPQGGMSRWQRSWCVFVIAAILRTSRIMLHADLPPRRAA